MATAKKLVPLALMLYCSPVLTELPFFWDWLDVNFSSFCYNYLAPGFRNSFRITEVLHIYEHVHLFMFIVLIPIFIVLNSLYGFPFIFHVYF